MTKPTRSSAWVGLAAQRLWWRGVHLRDLFDTDSDRAARYTFAAVTANVAAARAFGFAEERIFPMWDRVGGRYSGVIGGGLATGDRYRHGADRGVPRWCECDGSALRKHSRRKQPPCASCADRCVVYQLLGCAVARGATLRRRFARLSRVSPAAFPGNRPSTTLVMERIEPRTLGALLALYEHKVFTQGVIWNLNSFDQWGVELGKTIARTLLPALEGGPMPPSLDSSTATLIAKLRQN